MLYTKELVNDRKQYNREFKRGKVWACYGRSRVWYTDIEISFVMGAFSPYYSYTANVLIIHECSGRDFVISFFLFRTCVKSCVWILSWWWCRRMEKFHEWKFLCGNCARCSVLVDLWVQENEWDGMGAVWGIRGEVVSIYRIWSNFFKKLYHLICMELIV